MRPSGWHDLGLGHGDGAVGVGGGGVGRGGEGERGGDRGDDREAEEGLAHGVSLSSCVVAGVRHAAANGGSARAGRLERLPGLARKRSDERYRRSIGSL